MILGFYVGLGLGLGFSLADCEVYVLVLVQFDGFQKEARDMVKSKKGTTTLAFIFKDGVMVAADSRASMGGYICNALALCFRFGMWNVSIVNVGL